MKWRVIGLETNTAYMNMGIDEAIAHSVRTGAEPATMRFYKWKPSAVSIGRFQSLGDEVNVERCRELGIDYVRRITGGGAVYHDSNGEITYSVIAKEAGMPSGIHDSYRLICGWVINGLAALGIESSFAPINDIVVGNRKISGNAQTRRDGILLQHGTVLYDLDVERMFGVLRISKEKISDKLIKSVEERVTCVRDYSGVSQDGLYEALLGSFTDGKDFYMGNLSKEELGQAFSFSKGTYGTDAWNFSR